MLTFNQALAKANDYLATLNVYDDDSDRLVIVIEETIERPYGWFFFYDSEAFIKTQDFSHAIAGNAPILVDREGNIRVTGTAYPIEKYILDFDKLYQ